MYCPLKSGENRSSPGRPKYTRWPRRLLLIWLFQQNAADCAQFLERSAAPRIPFVRRWLSAGSKSEQGLECSHGLFGTIVPKHKFVQINRELISAHTVMGSDKLHRTHAGLKGQTPVETPESRGAN